MTADRIEKHENRDRVGCRWHTKIKRSSKKDAHRVARRRVRHALRSASYE